MVKQKNKRRIVMTEEEFYYIPLLESISSQLSSPKLLERILRGPCKSEKPGRMCDFCDGTFFAEHPVLGCDDKALQILLYYDDVNIVNPLSNKVHSLGFFYYQLLNLHPKYRSKVKSIYLLAICKKKFIKKYGLNKIFQPLIQDLKKLSSNNRGFPFDIAGIGTMHLRGSLLCVIADTPAAQACAGFKEGVGGAYCKCRHCMATFDTMQIYFTEEHFTLRSREDHEEMLQILENASSKCLYDYYSKKFGINYKSKLMEAPDFDVTQQLPVDVMHIFLEGIMSYHLKRLLHHYIYEITAFTINDLNKDVECFPLGYSEKKSRPIIIKETDIDFKSSTNLGQSASQMHQLIQMLPFILSKYVSRETLHWRCFLSAISIMVICMSHSIKCEDVVYLKSAIQQYLSLFKRLYNANITPKLHYLVHIPTMMFQFGPIIRAWCMRMEAKHATFKDLSKIIKNFKNLPYSLAVQHQQIVAGDSITLEKDADPCTLFANEIDFGSGKHVTDSRDLSYVRDCLRRFYGINCQRENAVFFLSSVTLNGILYKPGNNNFIMTSNDPPEFGRLTKIINVETCGLFVILQIMKTIRFCEDLNAYEIEEESLAQGNEVIHADEILFPQIYHMQKFEKKYYIVKREF